jgi:hypothetical protein
LEPEGARRDGSDFAFMMREALLLTRDGLSGAGSNIAKLLEFFGVPWRTETSTQFLACDRTSPSNEIGLFCSSDVFLELATQFTRDGDRRSRWREHVHSAFVYGGDDPVQLRKLLWTLTGNDATTDNGPDDCARDFFVAEDTELCGAMAGVRIATSASNTAAVVASLSGSQCRATELVSTAQGAIFLKLQHEDLPVFLSTFPQIIDLDSQLTTGVFDIRDHVPAALPIVLYVKWAFANICWQPQETSACLVIDDPLLARRYGYLNFDELLRLMKQHKFSTSIAFIPWNWSRSNREIAHLFTENPHLYSLSIHGCDHTRAEFGSSDRDRLYWKAQQALERMNRHGFDTGIQHDRVMVFPQGVFSRAAMDALKHTDFMAAVNNDVISAGPGARAITISDVWDTAVMAYGNFPILTRRYPWEGIENFAFDILLGKPAIIVIHHDFCHDRCLHLVKFVQRLNALKICLAWRSLGEVVRRSCRQRELSPGLVEVEMYATQLRLENQSGQRKRYLIRRRESEPSNIKEIRAGSRNVGWSSTDGRVAFEIELNPGENTMISLGFHHLTGDGRHADTLSYRTKAMLRRYLCEIRDNYVTPARFRLAGSC